MPNENLSRQAITERIRALESQRRDITREIQGLEAMERNHDWDDLSPMMNKCFRRKIVYQITNTREIIGYEYVCIIGLPPVETTRAGHTSMNKYQLPAIFFSYCANECMPFDTGPHDDYGDVFHYGTLFTGDLPIEYRNGAIFNGLHEQFVECTETEFMSAACERYKQFIQKIFELGDPRQ